MQVIDVPLETYLEWVKKTIISIYIQYSSVIDAKINANAIQLPNIMGVNWSNAQVQYQQSWIIFDIDY